MKKSTYLPETTKMKRIPVVAAGYCTLLDMISYAMVRKLGWFADVNDDCCQFWTLCYVSSDLLQDYGQGCTCNRWPVIESKPCLNCMTVVCIHLCPIKLTTRA
ncbi:uncharacterized protein LOC127093193 isoform X7 [Lathyrus oleraceus]|uniref:uncharacterized protein LOC127093193 isoform X7 n=1 Tax=Pisum sativum TaxID=3888 RepID=UPI0021D39FAE|nr:uncharacterized protein LOC127093193 isoform X7 [Pisum sativum]